MQSPMTWLFKSTVSNCRLSFAPEDERIFQQSYYGRVRATLRFSMFLLAGISMLSVVMPLADRINGVNLTVFMTVLATNLLLLLWSLNPEFALTWQPAVVAVAVASQGATLFQGSGEGLPFLAIYLFLIAFRVQRLQFRWMVTQFLGLLAVGCLSVLIHFDTPGPKILAMLLTSALLMIVPLLMTLRSERFERQEFWTKHSLALERNDERHKREQTEKMLHILSQAIGGIVHDLGNPLTSVQSGADTLLMFVKNGDADPETVQEFAEIIRSGAQMLNYLRLSLMEQTRVLEGKPVPVDLKPTSVNQIIKAGAQYQKPKFSAGRNVCLRGEELQVMADEMRMVTVFMNLIGNALKYSDGEVRIVWRTHENQVLIAVSDCGRAGKGISQAQAEGLFVAFGRLDTHAEVEGTGLGLLSVRKIVEAHGGEVYIEGYNDGYNDGTDASASFCTARGSYPNLLEEGFLTAFVTACPLEIVSPEVEPQEAIFQSPISAPEELVCLPN